MAAVSVICFGQAQAATSSLIQTAQHIVIATVGSSQQEGPDITITLQVQRDVTGTGLTGQISVRALNALPGFLNSDLAAGTNGLWFLVDTGGSLTVVPLMKILPAYVLVLPPGFDGSTAPRSASSLADKCALIAAASVAYTAGQRTSTGVAYSSRRTLAVAAGFLDVAAAADAAERAAVEATTSASSDTCTHLLGVVLGLQNGESAAAVDLSKNVSQYFLCPAHVDANLAVGRFNGTDPVAIRALGSLALGEQGLGSRTDLAAAEALARLHTKDSVPFLLQLLEHQEVLMMETGLKGLAARACGMAADPTDPQASGTNSPSCAPVIPMPSSQIAAMASNLGFGSAAQDASAAAFWKVWYSQYGALLP
jgi:hypothetical protein